MTDILFYSFVSVSKLLEHAVRDYLKVHILNKEGIL